MTSTYRQTWASVGIGALPTDWINLAKVGPAYPWLVAGAWSVKANAAGAHTLEQSGLAWPWYGGAPPLSFQRFNSPFHGLDPAGPLHAEPLSGPAAGGGRGGPA